MQMAVHVAELKVSINPSFVSSRVKVLERLGHVLVDMAPVQIHQTQSSLTDRIVTIRRLFKVVERGRVVLRHRFRAFQVHLQDKKFFRNKWKTKNSTICLLFQGMPWHVHLLHQQL